MSQSLPPASPNDDTPDEPGDLPTAPLPTSDGEEPHTPTAPLPDSPVTRSFAITPDRILEELPTESGETASEALHYIAFVSRDGRLDRVGLGTFSDVYAGHDRDGAPVAIKIFRGDDAETIRPLVAKEWRASQRDFGPRVVHSYAAYLVSNERGDRAWALIMNLVPGQNLAQVMTDVALGASIDHETQVRWLRAALDGLQALAAARHQLRDVKPENIGLDHEDRAQALPVFFDHGAAKREGTMTLMYAGTPAYAAPEWTRRTEGGDLSKVDIYSLGASLIDVFTGGQGFEGGVMDDERGLVGRPRLDDFRLSPDVARVLRGALVKDPALRPGVDELLDVLTIPTLTTPPWDPYRPYAAGAGAAAPDATTPLPTDRAEASSESDTAPLPDLHGAASGFTATPSPPLPTGLQGRPDPVRVPAARSVSPLADVRLLPLTEDIASLEKRGTMTPVRGRWLEKFAGVDPRYVVERSNRVVYNIVGLLLITYAVYATFAITALVTMATGDTSVWRVTVGISIGALVATVVVSVDRSIMAMSSVNLKDLDDPALDGNPVGKRVSATMILRVLFAVLFAVLVGEAANQVIFERDITAHMADVNEARVAERQAGIDADYAAERANQEAKVATAEAAIADYQSQIDGALARAAGEEAGTFGTMAAGCEEQCLLHLNQASALIAGQAAFNELRNGEITAARAELDTLDAAAALDLDEARVEIGNDDGLLSREEALWEMLTADLWMLARYAIVSLLLLFVELAAVLIKFATRGNNYERALARALRQEERADRLRHGMLRNLARRRARDNEKTLADADRAFYTSPARRSATWG
ncbi:DUF4407 domain-containing protein [Microbacterium sp. NPDC086615]|uniref:DUF4407 domain-containing protein n=1 Tax=Microbacterium sp. NPDC086615 TaxID=3154865 RepID=UPI003420F2B0